MSFANLDLESQKPLHSNKDDVVPKSPSSELDNIINKTSKQVQVFGGLVSQLDVQRRQLGSRRDTIQFRANIATLVSKITDMESGIEVLISNISQLMNKRSSQPQDSGPKLEISNRQIVIKERLVNEFNELHSQLVKSIRLYNEKKKAVAPKDQSETTPLLDQDQNQNQNQYPNQDQNQYPEQTQVQEQENSVNETELQYHLLLTEERNREINQVSQGIQEVNSIFKDLGELVNQQGEQLDSIEDNILQLHGNTQQAHKELVKADQYQRAKGKWSCILLVALTVIVLVIVLAVVS